MKAIKMDNNPIEKFDRKNELEKSGINNLIKLPIMIIGIEPIKIDLTIFWEK